MGFEGLEHLKEETGNEANQAHEKIKKLKTLELSSVRGKKAIKRVCMEVIGAVDNILLVHVNEEELLARKIKKDKKVALQYSDDDIWRYGARIRKDLDSKEWEKHPINGRIWYTKQGKILGIIYTPRKGKRHEIFIDRLIADSPVGAAVLIKAMKETLKELI